MKAMEEELLVVRRLNSRVHNAAAPGKVTVREEMRETELMRKLRNRT